MKLISTEKPDHERTLIIGIQLKGKRMDERESLQELAMLVESSGGEVIREETQSLLRPTAPFYIGKGKAEELALFCKEEKISTVIFDDDLTPAQGRNLEKIFEKKILDRTQLILDIFSQRAQASEGKLQIELAQLQYLLPRLTRMWTHLSKQSGGIGTRGPGETQLEVDRRRIQERIARLQKELREICKRRKIQREGRTRHQWPLLSFVGYTNAGKSTLFNRLTSASSLVADQLFATLDPTTRLCTLPEHKQHVLLSDTVGFIKKLPHHLVESFKGTLEEVREADILLHVVDASNSHYEEQIMAVQQVLSELGVTDKPQIIIFNKIDAITNPQILNFELSQYTPSIMLSSKSGEGVDGLLGVISQLLKERLLAMELKIPASQSADIAKLHDSSCVESINYVGEMVEIVVKIPASLQDRFKKYSISKNL